MDRYGYYQIGDYKTYSLHEMMDCYHKDPQPYKWVYNDDFFSQYDWTQEPTESIDELYKQRAIEVRKQYDYIVLYYSGGYDSTNMLYAFLDNGIYPDELCYFYSKHDSISHQYHERINFSWKKLDELEKRYPQIKIRRIEYSNIIFDWPNIIKNTNEQLNLNWDPIYYWGPRLSPHRIALDHMYEYIDDWKKLLNDNKSLCTLHGVDYVRPGYQLRSQEYVHNFSDLDVYGHLTPIRQMIDRKQDTLEFFYWSPTETCAKILIKQMHLSKKYHTILSGGEMLKLILRRDLVHINKKECMARFKVHDDIKFKKTMYPRLFKDNETYYQGNNKSAFFGNRDIWYFDSDLPGSREHWQSMYLSLWEKENEHWENFLHSDKNLGYRKIKSRPYIV